MNIEVQTLIDVYKQELNRLQNENITLKCELLQLKKALKEMHDKEGED